MVFILRFNEEMSFEQMAQTLGKSVGGLKANYFHAVQKIQKYVRSEMNK
jgi:RNA polymerase sigma-70 factor (ECF subfamily)